MRGKKTSPEDIYRVMTSYAITNNLSETARQTNIPFGTVKNIVDDNKNAEEFKRVQEEKREEFAEKASAIIDKILDRINREIDDEEKEIPLNHLTVAMGTLYDKKSLARGESTQNVGFSTNLSLDKLAEISGFKKDADAE